MKRILDPHLHLFDLVHGQYNWLKPSFPPKWPDKSDIVKQYDDAALQQSAGFSVAGYVHIEAGFDNQKGHREIANIEHRASLPMRSIGFIDITLAPAEFTRELNAQVRYQSFMGVRHILEPVEMIDENMETAENCTEENTEYPNDDNRQKTAQPAGKRQFTSILENVNSYTNLALLEKHGGIFELQCDVNNRELVVQIFAFFTRLPNLQLVLNHAGFAPSAFSINGQISAEFTDWKLNIQLLAQLPNIAVKCSGFEMHQRAYDKSQIQAVLTHCIDAFTYDNVMLASNFPLCELACSYDDYWQQILQYLSK